MNTTAASSSAERSSWRSRWAQRWTTWWNNRLPPSHRQTLTHRTVYILPTGAGWMLGATLLVLLVASINFQLNLGYLLTFLLAGSALSSMHIAHANLRGLTIQSVANYIQPTGASVTFHVNISTMNIPRHALIVRVRGAEKLTNPNLRHPASDSGSNSAHSVTHTSTNANAYASSKTNTVAPAHRVHLKADGAARVTLTVAAEQRGPFALPAVVVESVFPLGLFRVWAYHRPAADVLLYPAPETPAPPLPQGAGEGEDASTAHTTPHLQPDDEPDAVRPYQQGDSPRRIVWKKAATAWATGQGELLTRFTPSRSSADLWLREPAGLQGEARERHLRRLSAWVLAADQGDVPYGLRLRHTSLPPGTGAAHRQACLRALALA